MLYSGPNDVKFGSYSDREKYKYLDNDNDLENIFLGEDVENKE